MVAELAQRHRVQDLVQRPEAARQRTNASAASISSALRSNMVGDPQLGQIALADLAIEQPLREMPEHLGTGGRAARAVTPIRPTSPPP